MKTKDIGKRLRQAREAADLTQPQLAELAGVSQALISALERGVRKQSRSVVRLADALGVRPEWLSDGDGPMEAGPTDQMRAIHDLLGQIDSDRLVVVREMLEGLARVSPEKQD